MFLAFSGFGMLPVLGFVCVPLLFPSISESGQFASACVCTAAALVGLGAFKASAAPEPHRTAPTSPSHHYHHHHHHHHSRAAASPPLQPPAPPVPTRLAQAMFNDKKYLWSAFETLLLGSVCATVAFVVGRAVSSFGGELELFQERPLYGELFQDSSHYRS